LAEIVAYAEIYPTSMPLGDFVEIIRRIDVEYVRIVNTEPKTDGPRSNTRRGD
jgi:hypothetical protein